jgi:hypothetical protein
VRVREEELREREPPLRLRVPDDRDLLEPDDRDLLDDVDDFRDPPERLREPDDRLLVEELRVELREDDARLELERRRLPPLVLRSERGISC